MSSSIYEYYEDKLYFDFKKLMSVALRHATITEDDRDDKHQVALSFNDGGNRTISSWSSSCVVKGATKVGKTTVASLLVAALLGHKSNPYKGHLPDEAEILWIDTEQSRSHCYKVGARIGKLVLGEEKLHPRVKMLLIREYSPDVKWQLIRNAIKLNTNIKVIVIDNLADLVSSILDEEEASGLVGALLRLVEINSLLAINIIHTNKVNRHARGHLGSLSEQRAETVISVERSGKRIKVEGALTRNGPFPTIWYERQEDDIHFFYETDPKRDISFKKDFDRTPVEVHKEVLTSVFSDTPELFPHEFKAKIGKEYESKVQRIGLELIKRLQSYYVTIGLIQKEGSKLRMGF